MTAHRIRVRNNPYNMNRTQEDRAEYKRRWKKLDAANIQSGYAMSADLQRYGREWAAAGNHHDFPQFDDWNNARRQAAAAAPLSREVA